ncbi:hypothetical protein, partial [Gokushovirinae Fen672_31]|uniref:hypothetical protein n=1 Tax=Gokushovirinae Fen672_31 TaxID=1655656 RepID=UPI00063D5633
MCRSSSSSACLITLFVAVLMFRARRLAAWSSAAFTTSFGSSTRVAIVVAPYERFTPMKSV